MEKALSPQMTKPEFDNGCPMRALNRPFMVLMFSASALLLGRSALAVCDPAGIIGRTIEYADSMGAKSKYAGAIIIQGNGMYRTHFAYTTESEAGDEYHSAIAMFSPSTCGPVSFSQLPVSENGSLTGEVACDPSVLASNLHAYMSEHGFRTDFFGVTPDMTPPDRGFTAHTLAKSGQDAFLVGVIRFARNCSVVPNSYLSLIASRVQ